MLAWVWDPKGVPHSMHTHSHTLMLESSYSIFLFILVYFPKVKVCLIMRVRGERDFFGKPFVLSRWNLRDRRRRWRRWEEKGRIISHHLDHYTRYMALGGGLTKETCPRKMHCLSKKNMSKQRRLWYSLSMLDWLGLAISEPDLPFFAQLKGFRLG